MWRAMAGWQFRKSCLLAVMLLQRTSLFDWQICHRVAGANINVPPLPNSKDFLDAHNAARAKVDVPPLQWNMSLAAYALTHGQRQRDYHNCSMEHSNSAGMYGENLFWGSNLGFSAADAVNLWISEQEFYNYDENTCAADEECGHYTQVVWRNSTQVGCAAVHCYDDSIFMLCEYFPRGNVALKRPY